MEYIAYGAVITNRLIYADKSTISDIMGGSGFYAYSGLRLCTPKSMLLAGVGEDCDTYYGQWLDRNQGCRDGLKVEAEKSCYNELVYAQDGTYIEYSIYDEADQPGKVAGFQLPPRELEPFLGDAKGVCLSVPIDEELSDILVRAKEKHPFKVMWEVPASMVSTLAKAFAQEGYAGLKKHLRGVDIFSTNKPESFEIFGVSRVEDGIEAFKKLGMPCYYRMGTRGACMIEGDQCATVPMICLVPHDREVDPTGCGNSSTAAAMWAYCEGYDLLKTCIVGNVVAAYNVQQYGPYPDAGAETHAEMMAHVERIYRDLRENAEAKGAKHGK